MKSVGKIADANNSASAALDIMRGWEWGFIDYDGQRAAYGKALGIVVSKLGMAGLARPQDAVLSLLCNGELVARGDFHWQKFEGGHHHRLNGNANAIVPQRWISLADIMEKERQELAEGRWPLGPVNLPQLGLSGCAAYEWSFPENQIGTATCSAGAAVITDGHIEELFWAWEIEVWPKCIFEPTPEPATNLAPVPPNAGGRPPVANWMDAALELAGRQYRGDFKPATVAEVTRALREWLDDQGIHLSDSTIRPHAKRIFVALGTWDD